MTLKKTRGSYIYIYNINVHIIHSDMCKPDQTRSDQTRSDPIRSDQTRSDPIRPDQTRSDQVRPVQVRPDPIRPDQTRSCVLPTHPQCAPLFVTTAACCQSNFCGSTWRNIIVVRNVLCYIHKYINLLITNVTKYTETEQHDILNVLVETRQK